MQPLMALACGTKLGPYEIVAPLGAGGMGEVYRAWDTKLGRDVAIKVLPQAFAADPERTARFEREAKLLASLNHPNIASIYGLEDAEGIRALVMELVRGPTLAERLQQGAIPAEEMLPLAKQIAEALEYAHERGIVHRDLKPANIKLSPESGVKVLDFGLAKAMQGDTAASDALASPTISRMATQAGIILGTAAYMSPEQAKGKPVDRRTDIWAFGCVSFEMLAGKMTFGGETVTDVLAAVVMKDPDWTQLPAGTPLRMRELLQRCLRKEQKQRLQSIGDARITIEEVLTEPTDAGSVQPIPSRARSFLLSALPWALAALVATVAAFLLYPSRTAPEHPQPTIRASVVPPPDYGFFGLGQAVISPDGRFLVFVTTPSNQPAELWIRPLDSLVAKPLAGTQGAQSVFWSPDSQWIAFYSRNKLKKIPAGGGAPLDICDSANGRGGTWNANGTILFVPDIGVPVYSVPAAGGTPVAVTRLDKSLQEVAHRWPVFLPDGKHFLFFSQGSENSIYAASLESSERKLILKNDSNVVYVHPGYLLYVRDHVLMAQTFDAQKLALTGPAVAIAEDVPVFGTIHRGMFSASQNGVLSVETQLRRKSQAVWLDRSGNTLDRLGEPAMIESFRISPDGEKVAFSIDDPQQESPNLWVYAARGNQKARLTFGPATAQNPVWAPDGNRIAFNSNLRGSPNLFTIPVTGVGRMELLLSSESYDVPTSWSPDGRYLAFMRRILSDKSHWEVFILPLSGDKKPYPLLESSYDQGNAAFSPDGKWLALESNETGRYEIYLVPFPQATSKLAVSTDGGRTPKWSPDGQELFYGGADGRLTVASLHPGNSGLQVTATHPLFQYDSLDFDLSSDGKRFLTSRDAENQALAPITLVTNWMAELKK
jgi:serine/threonine protein kinase/Tol biopolymer transport system component